MTPRWPSDLDARWWRESSSGGRLAGFVIEGTVPYGKMTSSMREAVMRKAVYSGLGRSRRPRQS